MMNKSDLYAISKHDLEMSPDTNKSDSLKISKGAVIKFKKITKDNMEYIVLYIYQNDINNEEIELKFNLNLNVFNQHFDIIGDFDDMMNYIVDDNH